ncbi:MAG TPA: GNAT family N-acetyltransferase [Steroidobacteraceae bacterium]|nr:GNAT family N-acetyltransferase [Steroidobacteraceae bacterium]
MIVCETERLRLSHLSSPDDAPFILELLNDPGFIQNIGDRGVRTLPQADDYIESGPVASYEKFGFGLYLVETRQPSVRLGICGLLRRDFHPDVEIGFAFLPRFRGKGYAIEAASAVMTLGLQTLRLERIVALTAPHNHDSMKLLERLGLKFERMIQFPGHPEESRLFAYQV